MSTSLEECAITHWVYDAEIWFAENQIADKSGRAFKKVNNLFLRMSSLFKKGLFHPIYCKLFVVFKVFLNGGMYFAHFGQWI